MLSWGEFAAIYGTAPKHRYIARRSMSLMSMQLLHNTVFWVNCKCTEFCWKRSLFINVTVYKVNKAQWDSEILPMSMAECSFYVEHICSYQRSSSCDQKKQQLQHPDECTPQDKRDEHHRSSRNFGTAWITATNLPSIVLSSSGWNGMSQDPFWRNVKAGPPVHPAYIQGRASPNEEVTGEDLK